METVLDKPSTGLNGMFQSPCGEIVNGNKGAKGKKQHEVKFQFPCGEMVGRNQLKNEVALARMPVSVPLRGNGW